MRRSEIDQAPLLGTRRRTFGSYYTLSNAFRKQNYISAQQASQKAQINFNNEGSIGGASLNDVSEDRQDVKEGELKRELTVWDLIAYGLAATLGTGILVTVGQVANQFTGPAVVFSFLFAGFASFLSALCYSEFAARIPVSGSAYSFTYISLGEVVAWFVGWNLTLEYAISASAVAGGWTAYVVSALQSVGVDMPPWTQGIYINELITITPLSSLVCVICTCILLFGMKESARFNIVMTAINVCIILFFIIAGSFHVKTANWSPFFPYGMAGTWAGVGKVFFSYIGFDSVSTLAGEVKRPSRDLPIGIVGTLLVVTAAYIGVALVLTGMQPYDQINTAAPLSFAFQAVGQSWAGTLIAFGSVTTITATCLASLVGQPRIFYQMAQDGLMFEIFGALNKKGVPVYGTIITGTLSAIISLFFDLNVLLNMISIGTLLAFTVVCGGVLILRFQREDDDPRPAKRLPIKLLVLLFFFACCIFALPNQLTGWMNKMDNTVYYLTWSAFSIPMIALFIPFLFFETTDMPATFKCPLVPWVPCLGIVMNTWFILTLDGESIIRLLVWTAIGMAIYLGYGIRHSKLNKD